MRKVLSLFALSFCILSVTAAWAMPNTGPSIQCNYDLTNTGSNDAWDVAVVLNGVYSTNGFYDGPFYTDPTVTTSGGHTTLHWTGIADAITNGTKIHVGYTPVGTTDCPLLEIYWTDINGNRIRTSFVGTAYNHYTGTATEIKNVTTYPIDVKNVRWACQAAALPLAALNATNEYLSQAMVTIGEARTLKPGETWEIPVKASCTNCYCVTNYTTSGAGLGAIFSPWVQEHVD